MTSNEIIDGMKTLLQANTELTYTKMLLQRDDVAGARKVFETAAKKIHSVSDALKTAGPETTDLITSKTLLRMLLENVERFSSALCLKLYPASYNTIAPPST